jgi:hypothetical protein
MKILVRRWATFLLYFTLAWLLPLILFGVIVYGTTAKVSAVDDGSEKTLFSWIPRDSLPEQSTLMKFGSGLGIFALFAALVFLHRKFKKKSESFLRIGTTFIVFPIVWALAIFCGVSIWGTLLTALGHSPMSGAAAAGFVIFYSTAVVPVWLANKISLRH